MKKLNYFLLSIMLSTLSVSATDNDPDLQAAINQSLATVQPPSDLDVAIYESLKTGAAAQARSTRLDDLRKKYAEFEATRNEEGAFQIALQISAEEEKGNISVAQGMNQEDVDYLLALELSNENDPQPMMGQAKTIVKEITQEKEKEKEKQQVNNGHVCQMTEVYQTISAEFKNTLKQLEQEKIPTGNILQNDLRNVRLLDKEDIIGYDKEQTLQNVRGTELYNFINTHYDQFVAEFEKRKEAMEKLAGERKIKGPKDVDYLIERYAEKHKTSYDFAKKVYDKMFLGE